MIARFPSAAQSSDWRFRNAAAMAVGCIVEGLQDPAESDVEPIIPLIWNLTQDKKACVRDTAVWSIGRIIEFLPQFIPTKLQVLVDGLMQRLADEPRVAFSTCWTFSALVKAAYEASTKVLERRKSVSLVLLLRFTRTRKRKLIDQIRSFYRRSIR